MNDKIKDIAQALDEKYRREQTNLDLKKEKERLCNEMKVLDDINAVLNSTSRNKVGCPIIGEEYAEKVGCREIKVEPKVEEKVVYKEPEQVVEVHGADCHCSKCCPNPNPTWFERNKNKVYFGLIWGALIILAVGWSPSGTIFKEMQEGYVNLIVDFFKMGIFGVAGFLTYKLLKEDK